MIKYQLFAVLFLLLPGVALTVVLSPLENSKESLTESYRAGPVFDDVALGELRRVSHLNGQEEIVDVRSLANRVFLLLERGQTNRAVSVVRQLVQLAPASAEAHRLKGHVLFLTGNLPEATVELRKAVDLAPDSQIARRSLAEALRHTGDFDQALGWLASVLLDGGGLPVWNDFLQVLGAWSGDTEPLPAADPTLGEMFYFRALAELKNGQVNEAIRLLVRAFAMNPDLPGPANDLGALLVSRGQPEAGLVMLKRAAYLSNSNGPAAENLAALEQEIDRQRTQKSPEQQP